MEIKNRKNPGILQVSILFSIVILLFLLVGVRAQNREFYSGVLITEFGVILLPPLILLIATRCNLKNTLRLNRVKAIDLVIVFFMMAFAIPVAGVFNLINLWLVNSIFGKISISQPPVADNSASLLINIMVIAGSAGLCEEFLFRGVIQKGLNRLGAAASILLTAFLFSLTHMDFQKILGTFFLGALIGFIVYRTNSLFSGILAHFTNNAIVVVLGYISVKVMEALEGSGFEATGDQVDMSNFFNTFGSMPKEQLMLIAFVYGIMFLILGVIFLCLVFAFIKLTGKGRYKRDGDEGTGEAALEVKVGSVNVANIRKGLLWLIPGILLINIVYYLEILKFKGLENGLADVLQRMMGI